MGLNILTPGSKKRLLTKLVELTNHVHNDSERETILWLTSELMPAVVSQLNYYDPALDNYVKKVIKKRWKPGDKRKVTV